MRPALTWMKFLLIPYFFFDYFLFFPFIAVRKINNITEFSENLGANPENVLRLVFVVVVFQIKKTL